ncbi:pirin family protein [Planosporangium thailandense]|uniref:Pirin family protein n=1 Tax=Planosporangium thailandense TaxID=765197 RepID=A0ABX0Y5R6_9ACTN|nr:pirin family protein [Planosporangium thailandense]NJC72895.1 pirin family protein [Planosporangium thailandense]
MSGPVDATDAPPAVADASHPTAPCVEVSDSRDEQVGKIRVRRALPRKGRRTVGAWCFADHMGPADVTENSGLDVGPHPHIGLQTVTWLIDGQVLHRDSLGSEQVIKPGQLNLMTSGDAVSHAEEATGHYRGTLEGIQLWVALPEATRHGGAAFEHHAELPQGELDGAVATVLVGDFANLSSPARHDTPLVGVELALHRPTTVPLRPDFEYAVVVLEGSVGIGGTALPPGKLGYLGRGRDELRVDVREPARAMLLGGEPFADPIVMWWNFVARSRAEIDAAYESWARQDDRFGRVRSSLPLIPAKAPYWHQA